MFGKKNINRNDLYNIDKYRRKKKTRSIIKKTIIAIFILAILSLVYFTIEGIRQKINSQKTDNASFPIELRGEEPSDLAIIDGQIVVLGKSKNIFYGENAKKTGEIVHRNVNPVVKISGKRVLTYELNGYNFRVDNGDKEVGAIKLDNKILFAQISSNGYVAVVTFENRFNSTLTIYDSGLNQIYKYSENTKYMTYFNFISNKKGIITMQTTQDGKSSSVIRVLDFEKEKDTVYLEKQYIGEVIYKTYYKDEKIYIYTDKACVILDDKGTELNRFQYEGELSYMEHIDGKSIILLKDIVQHGKINVFILDEENKQVATNSFIGEVKDVYCTNDSILILTYDNIIKYDYKLKQIYNLDNNSGYSHIANINDNLYAINSEYLYKIEGEKGK